MPLAFVPKVLNVRKHLMSCQDDFRNFRGLPDVVGQGLGDVAVSHGSSVEDPDLRRIRPSGHLLLNRPLNQFPGRLEDENSVVISDEVTGSVDYLMGLAGAAGSGTVFDTHGIPIDDLFGIYHFLSDKWYRVPSQGEETEPRLQVFMKKWGGRHRLQV